MTREAILLQNVLEPYHAAFVDCAHRQRLDLLPCAHLSAATAAEHEPLLAVLALDSDAEAGFERLRALHRCLASAPVVVLGSAMSVDGAVRALRQGAADVIGLPAPPAAVAARALLHLRAPRSPAGDDALVGLSAALVALRREIAAVAPMESTVLLLGETGTGKGVAARLVHACSARASGPFVHVDCAALSPALIESELFGHERGSFTGAVERRAGRFELARDGTVFLDEIGDLELRLQSKLLRVLQDREYERIGGSRTLAMTARVIAATSHDLRDGVARGRFRADLYFRLNVFRLRMPPLRERLEDLPLLVRAGLERVSRRLEVATPAVGEGLYTALRAHTWPGNVRELMNVLERLVVRRRGGLVEAEDWLDALDDSPWSDTQERPHRPLRLWEDDETHAQTRPRNAIAGALAGAGGNVARAARRLGVPRSTLRYWIQQHGLAELVPKD